VDGRDHRRRRQRGRLPLRQRLGQPAIQLEHLHIGPHQPLRRDHTDSEQASLYATIRREGWLQRSLDGRFVYVGDVIDTSTRQSVANLQPLYDSRVFLEVDWSNGVPVATSTRSGWATW
jgi:hypothetical protein